MSLLSTLKTEMKMCTIVCSFMVKAESFGPARNQTTIETKHVYRASPFFTLGPVAS